MNGIEPDLELIGDAGGLSRCRKRSAAIGSPHNRRRRRAVGCTTWCRRWSRTVTGVLLQFTLLPLVVLVVPRGKGRGVVPRREMMKPWQYPPGDGFGMYRCRTMSVSAGIPSLTPICGKRPAR